MTTLIVIGFSLIVFGLFVLCACWLTSAAHEQRAEAEFWRDHRPPATDDPQEWTGPLQTGSRSAERAMIRFHKKHGLLLWKRTSDAGRKLVVAVEKHRPRRGETGWGRHASPVPEPPLDALPPEPAPDPGEHFDVGGKPVEEYGTAYPDWPTGEWKQSVLDELLAQYMPDGAS